MKCFVIVPENQFVQRMINASTSIHGNSPRRSLNGDYLFELSGKIDEVFLEFRIYFKEEISEKLTEEVWGEGKPSLFSRIVSRVWK